MYIYMSIYVCVNFFDGFFEELGFGIWDLWVGGVTGCFVVVGGQVGK